MKKYIVIVAGGKGLRMGNDVPKQFLPVADRPILMRTIDAFEQWDAKAEKVLVLPENQIPYWNELCENYHFKVRKLKVVSGGATRFHSVKNALDTLSDDGFVAIHDGVRPFVSAALIDRCFDLRENEFAAIPVVPVNDSLRKVDGCENVAVSRAEFRAVQTPQVFDLQMLKKAYEQNLPQAEKFTDDASVIETLGCRIKLVEGLRENIKITTPKDIAIAEAMLKK